MAQWLLVVAALVLAMVTVGGITRLTESGLSITEWRPVGGVVPPLSMADWQAAFDSYKRVPQYAAIHADMTMAQFQVIFFWEWVHRLLGRVIGLAFALPLLWFWLRGAIPAGYKPRLLALLALGTLQGAVGWWMVTSGLFAGTAVSHYRLAVHLLLALTLLAGLVWTALDLFALARDPMARPARLTPFALGIVGVLYVQLLYGAWVAGLRAGKVTQRQAADERPFPADRHRLVARRSGRFQQRSVSGALHSSLVGVGGGRRAGDARGPGEAGRGAPRKRGDPCRHRNTDTAGHRDGDVRGQYRARDRASGGWRAADRQRGVGRACAGP